MPMWDNDSLWSDLGLDMVQKNTVPMGPSQAALKLRDELGSYFRSLPTVGRQGEFRMEVGDLLSKAQVQNLSPCQVWLEASEHRWLLRQQGLGELKVIGDTIWTRVIEMAKKYI